MTPSLSDLLHPLFFILTILGIVHVLDCWFGPILRVLTMENPDDE